MSKSLNLLNNVLLIDVEGNRSRIVHCDSDENSFRIYTQSSWERSEGLVTKHTIKSEEMLVSELEIQIAKQDKDCTD